MTLISTVYGSNSLRYTILDQEKLEEKIFVILGHLTQG